jgi:hypothetical protein
MACQQSDRHPAAAAPHGWGWCKAHARLGLRRRRRTVSRGFAEGAGDLGEQRGLAHGGEADESHPRIAHCNAERGKGARSVREQGPALPEHLSSAPAREEEVSFSFPERHVLAPTDGTQMHGAARRPPFCTSNPAPAPPPPPPPLGSSSSRRSLASLAFSMPRWPAVALFFCVRAISFSISCGEVGSKGLASIASAWRAAGACRCMRSHASKAAASVLVNMLRRQSCMHFSRCHRVHRTRPQAAANQVSAGSAPQSSPRQTWL